jgi:hypothetical protein
MKWYVSNSNDRQLEDEEETLRRITIECRANIAEQNSSWTRAERLWRSIDNQDRADAAREKAIAKIRTPFERGLALLKARDFLNAREAFDAAGEPDWSLRAVAMQYQREGECLKAAELWKSLGDTAMHAAAMAQFARSQDDWIAAAGWHRAAGQKSLAAQAERTARAKHAAESDRIRREHATLF